VDIDEIRRHIAYKIIIRDYKQILRQYLFLLRRKYNFKKEKEKTARNH